MRCLPQAHPRPLPAATRPANPELTGSLRDPEAGRGQGVGGDPTRRRWQRDARRHFLNDQQQLDAPLPLPLPRKGKGDAVLAHLEF